MKIGYRTIKTAIGTPIAIWIAQLFGVTNFVSAGILTILCIQPSRKRSVLSAWHRFVACMLAILFSFVFFEVIGYYPIAIGIMLAFFIPTTVWLKITPGIVTSSVIILHLYSAKEITVAFVIDEILLILVGLGVALVLNLYMPSLDNKLQEKQRKLEQNFQIILKEIALYIRDKNEDWTGKEITETQELLEEATELVARDRENHLLRSKHLYHDYFYMRTRQFELLKRMLPLVSKLPRTDAISLKIADFFEKLADAVHPGNTAILYLNELDALRSMFDQQPLPKTKEAFETRANLFRLLHEIEDYLLLKKRFKKSDIDRHTVRRLKKEAE
ncbi:aromatic acid exporter family protein [Oceanobacillus halotolerans]|uniref:aromatic acid exporter family protein n=1 Tax=Oceanobacillus halotolerans TaxID=2663380 RepID=UPI001969CA57|nr:aromatic acid exporter family protein [Oceanobacillus halotolerans]